MNMNAADDNLHFSSQMLANKREPYDLPEGGKKGQNKILWLWGEKKKPSAWVEKSLSNVLYLCWMQINLKQAWRMTHSADV